MDTPLIECVPNISEGRDLEKINCIVNAVTESSQCIILGVEPDKDYNRTVITFAGSPTEVVNGALALIRKSIELLDMRSHVGEHPRLGVVDVCPLVPLRGITLEECALLAKSIVEVIAKEYQVPLFLYGAAATSPTRVMLSALRKGEYEGLEARLNGSISTHGDETRYPDAGAKKWSEVVAKSGGITVGARSILVAYNVNFNEKDARVSKSVASLVRTSGRVLKSEAGGSVKMQGLLNNVQGMGVVLDGLGISQVSMNLLDVSLCPLHVAFKTCESIAKDHGIEACGSEIVGLVPLSAMLEAGKFFQPALVEESDLVQAAMDGLGLNTYHQFVAEDNIIEWAIKKKVNQ